MRRMLKTVALGSTILCLSSAYASSNPTTFLGPTVRGVYTAPISTVTAYSLAAEVGAKNERVGGALGWKLRENQRFKIAAEYLWQDITYNFFAGNTDQWVHQGALAAYYQYDFADYSYKPQFGLDAYLSHAPSKSLSTQTGTFLSNSGVVTSFTDIRRIAGSNAGGISPGVTAQPWTGGKVGLDLNYDNVRYDTSYINSHNAVGFGGTAKLSQALTDAVGLNLSAGVRQPFNDYQASIDWATNNSYGRWVLRVGGDYNAGKNTLPNTYNAGITVNYFADTPAAQPAFKDKVAVNWKDQPMPAADHTLLDWTADGVIMPRVLAIADQQVTPACTDVPAFTGTIANQTYVGALATTIATASNFSGQGLVYTVASTQTGGAGTGTITINSSTGLVTVDVLRANFSVTVTATNACGSITSNTFTLTDV